MTPEEIPLLSSCDTEGDPCKFTWHLRRSQNPRMSGVGRALESSSSAIPAMEQEHPDEVTQEGVQAGWNVCREGDSTTSLGSLGQALPPSP